MRRFIFAVFALTVLAACQPEVTEVANPLVGVWEVSEVSVTSPDTSYTITNPPSLYFFTERHYSVMRVRGGEPRELFAGDAPVIGSLAPTDDERLAAWSTFSAHSGTYEISGSTLTIQPIVAKHPNIMSGISLNLTYQAMEGMLHLTFVYPWLPNAERRYTLIPAR